MASNLENLTTAHTNLVTALVTATANPKPSYSIDGQSVDHTSYISSLIQQIRDLDEAIAREAGPEEHQSQGLT